MRRVRRIAAGPQIYYSALSDKLRQKLMDNNVDLNRDVDAQESIISSKNISLHVPSSNTK